MNLFRSMLMIIGIVVIFGAGILSCDRVDKALEAVDKAKNLQSEIEKKAGELKKNVEQSTEDIAGRFKKGTENRDSSNNEAKRSENGDKSGKEEQKNKKDHDDKEKD